MILPEYLGKQVLDWHGIAIPRGSLVRTGADAQAVAGRLGGKVAIKAQIPIGGRGRAGGVAIASDQQEARRAADALIGSSLLGYMVDALLVEELVTTEREFYLAIMADTAAGYVDLIFSPQGGVNIEELTSARHENVHRIALEPSAPFDKAAALSCLEREAVDAELLGELVRVSVALHRAFTEMALILAEINPLALCADDRLVALDCKMEIDDNVLLKRPEFLALRDQLLGGREREAAEVGASYVPLEGDIGLIASGAGLGMATMDLMRLAGLEPANFLDTGGGITRHLIYWAVGLVLEPTEVKAGLMNLYGGINPMLEAARGIIEAIEDLKIKKPLVVKVLGNDQEEAWSLLERAGITVVKTGHTEAAVELLARMVGE